MKMVSWQVFGLEVLLKVALAKIFYDITLIDSHPNFSFFMAILFGIASGSLIVLLIVNRGVVTVEQRHISVVCGFLIGVMLYAHLAPF